jgi:pimeloyl-ACP methyl ester carboxylesterase
MPARDAVLVDEVYYETFGDPDDPPLLLIPGHDGQMIWWRHELCQRLAQRGFYVIRCDLRIPDYVWTGGLAGRIRRRRGRVVDAIGDDVMRVLDRLGVQAAHLVGESFGGAIAQYIAIAYPQRTRSLTSIMSMPGRPGRAWRRSAGWRRARRRLPTSRRRYTDALGGLLLMLTSPGYTYYATAVRKLADRSYERGGAHRAPIGRLLDQLRFEADRHSALHGLRVPALVVHGDSDPLIPPSAGTATAAALADAELLLVRGMGHDLPADVWPALVEAIVRTAERVKRVCCPVDL